jgi:hypothetical protein
LLVNIRMTLLDSFFVVDELRKLIVLKEAVGEKYLHKKDDKLNERILNLFELIELSKESLVANRADMSLLNEFFLKMLYAEANH